jgi:hypothetical protein
LEANFKAAQGSSGVNQMAVPMVSRAINARNSARGCKRRDCNERYCAVSCLIIFLFAAVLPLCARAQANPAGFDDVVLKAAAAREQNDVPQAIEL